MNPLSVPPELWVEIFKEIHHTELSSIVATCRTFLSLARPLHLAVFVFRPHGLEYDLARRPSEPEKLCVIASPVDNEEARARLDFWTSEAIAPLVRRCIVIPWGAEHKPPGYGRVVDAGHTLPLLDIFIERLRRFSRIQSLYLDEIWLTAPLVASIYRNLLRLEELSIGAWKGQTPVSFASDAESGPPIAKFSISTIGFRATNIGFRATNSDLLAPWLPFLSQRHLQEIKLDSRLHDWRTANTPVLSSVKTLYLDIGGRETAIENENVVALSHKFPSVRNLYLTTGRTRRLAVDAGAACDALLRQATNLRMPFWDVRSCLPRAKRVLELEITGTSSSKTAQLIAHLNNDRFSSITTFVCPLVDPPNAADLTAILRCFPQLRHLRMRVRIHTHVDDDGPDNILFLNSLASAGAIFPQRITTIVMTIFKVRRPSDPHPSPCEFRGRVPDATVIRDSMIERNPSLTTLWVQARSVLIAWRRRQSDASSSWHVTDEICTEDPKDVRGKYPLLDMFWDTRGG